MNVLLVPPLEPPRAAELDNTLEAMQQAVGGPIQAVYPFEEPVALICHEEGKLVGLPLNRCLRLENGEIYDITFVSGCQQPELVQYLKERRLYVNEPVESEEES